MSGSKFDTSSFSQTLIGWSNKQQTKSTRPHSTTGTLELENRGEDLSSKRKAQLKLPPVTGEKRSEKLANKLFYLQAIFYNEVVNYRNQLGHTISDPFVRLPNKRFYPMYYDDIENPISLKMIRKRIQTKKYVVSGNTLWCKFLS